VDRSLEGGARHHVLTGHRSEFMSNPRHRKSLESSNRIAATPGTELTQTGSIPNHDKIARRAYQLFEERGGEPGREWEDWFRAEREHEED
jgi:hypothetical protein